MPLARAAAPPGDYAATGPLLACERGTRGRGTRDGAAAARTWERRSPFFGLEHFRNETNRQTVGRGPAARRNAPCARRRAAAARRMASVSVVPARAACRARARRVLRAALRNRSAGVADSRDDRRSARHERAADRRGARHGRGVGQPGDRATGGGRFRAARRGAQRSPLRMRDGDARRARGVRRHRRGVHRRGATPARRADPRGARDARRRAAEDRTRERAHRDRRVAAPARRRLSARFIAHSEGLASCATSPHRARRTAHHENPNARRVSRRARPLCRSMPKAIGHPNRSIRLRPPGNRKS
ncbi:transcriptional regulator, MarR family [Burkholderia pseudomallei MSHR435]|nr:transcriptional regulator, MarR family [Burkholderia pseudomallei MSHR435]